MTKTSYPMMVLIFIFHIIITVAVAGRDIPNANIKQHDGVNHPESFVVHDRGYLIPGLGRGIKPKCKDGFNPFTYNPVTGHNDRVGGYVPGFGRVGRGSYVPGGDDTFVPNPGFEVPNPSSSTTPPSPTGN